MLGLCGEAPPVWTCGVLGATIGNLQLSHGFYWVYFVGHISNPGSSKFLQTLLVPEFLTLFSDQKMSQEEEERRRKFPGEVINHPWRIRGKVGEE